ncbi:carboxylesterase/lipase family protein [Sphingomonas sp. MMS12-HWE2-04]|uniref:carboxylesterase/lipase family protein n=1 Tax=Sphingomonas sp. MMS12-HWE2-04 TaxID=3234199 RepID=UPI00384D82B5
MKRVFLAALLALTGTPAAAQAVHTAQGDVSGITLNSGVEAWLGIPFAAPPVGDLRWRPPQPAAPWQGVHPATQFAPSCMQPLRDHGIAYYVGDDPVAEDCLYLNVWARKGARADARLPVIVYVYGGSFVAGSARKPLYVGDRLAAKGAIVVGFNYRLGALGFLAHPDLTAESPAHASGNYGVLDQIAALQWVHDNIAAFGGDPARVTIMGQSAGAISLALLQASPAAKPLFQRIIALSGSPYLSAGTGRSQTLASGEAAGTAFQQKLGAPDLTALRRIPADRIVAAQGPLAMPIVDGLAVPRDPAEVYAAEAQADVPILLGTVRDEALSPLAAVSTLADYRAALAKSFGDRADAVAAQYPARSDAEVPTAARALAHDIGFSTMMRSWARMQATHGKAPVYAYWFDRRHPYSAGVRFTDLDPATTGVNHTDDVPYWLGTFESLNGPRRTRDWSPADRALGDRMQAAILAFAATGDPNSPALGISWPRYDTRSERMAGFGDTVRALSWPDRDRMDKLAALGIPDPRTAKDKKK